MARGAGWRAQRDAMHAWHCKARRPVREGWLDAAVAAAAAVAAPSLTATGRRVYRMHESESAFHPPRLPSSQPAGPPPAGSLPALVRLAQRAPGQANRVSDWVAASGSRQQPQASHQGRGYGADGVPRDADPRWPPSTARGGRWRAFSRPFSKSRLTSSSPLLGLAFYSHDTPPFFRAPAQPRLFVVSLSQPPPQSLCSPGVAVHDPATRKQCGF